MGWPRQLSIIKRGVPVYHENNNNWITNHCTGFFTPLRPVKTSEFRCYGKIIKGDVYAKGGRHKAGD